MFLFYVLVEYNRTTPTHEHQSESTEWFELSEMKPGSPFSFLPFPLPARSPVVK